MTVAHVHSTYQLVPFTYSEEVIEPSAEEVLLDTLARSDGQVVASAQRTAEKFQRFMQQMQQRFDTLATRNEGLCQELVTLESQHREVKAVHKTETATLQEEVAGLKQLVQQLRQEAAESTRQADERIATALTAQTVAVQTAIQAADARVAAAVQTEQARAQAAQDAAVRIATLAGDARVTALRRELESKLAIERRSVHSLCVGVRDLNTSLIKLRTPLPTSNPSFSYFLEGIRVAQNLFQACFYNHVVQNPVIQTDCRRGDGVCLECRTHIGQQAVRMSQ